ncbi:MAG: ATP synthase F1 subunit gamma [Verrucomicrobia bacterium]|nr:ATP synthase F1 subunit gamma [Verrucomicrobiota bacterium]
MANTREIRRRIKSIKNTAQITKAMQMVAASKMRRAQAAALAGKSYAALMNDVLVSVQERVDVDAHPLLQKRPVKKELVILISTEKGLCGALNTNLFRELNRFEGQPATFVCSGRKGVQFVTRTGKDLLADFHLKDNPSFAETKTISKFALDKFVNGEVDKVSVAFSDFVNTLTQKPTVKTLLPISREDLKKGFQTADQSQSDVVAGTTKSMGGYLFEPGPDAVLDAVLPQYLHFQVYQMVLDARASEHSARMVAMKSATDNAKSLVKDLTLEYNKVRQAGITTELLEITTAQMVLN